MDIKKNLFTARTTSGSSGVLDVAAGQPGEFAYLTAFIYGTWDSSQIVIEATNDGTNWFELTDTIATADLVVNISIRCKQIRATLSAAGGSTSLNVDIF